MTAPVRPIGRLAFGCLVVFLAPFCLVGVVTGVTAVKSLVDGKPGDAGLLAIFALAFGGAGFGMLAALLAGRRRLGRYLARREANPGAPWRWREDWASGRITDSNRSGMIFAWVFAGFWNLIALPAGFFSLREVVKGNIPALLGLLFPLVGAGLLVWAVRATIRLRKFGVSILELTTNPGVIGGRLAGVVLIRGMLLPEHGFLVALSSVRRVVSGSGKNRSTSESILWQEELTVHPSRRSAGTAIPFAFPIPADQPETTLENPDDRVLWRLTLEAAVPGVDYSAAFEVPVMRTADSPPAGTPVEPAARVDPGHFRQSGASRIRVTTNRRGTEIVFPAARNRGPALLLTFFVLVWSGVTWILSRSDAPRLFPWVFGGFDALLIYGMVQAWLATTRILVDRGVMTVARGLVFPGRERRINAEEIERIAPKIGMQMGARPYYDIEVVLNDGGSLKAGTGVRDKREAEWLAALMQRALTGQ